MTQRTLDPQLTRYINSVDFGEYNAFKSNTERMFYETGMPFLQEAFGSKPVLMFYEWLSFRLVNAVYTPDFLVVFEDGRMAFVEIKGSKKQRHYLLSRYKMRIAASLNPYFSFCMATPVPKTRYRAWDIDHIQAEPSTGNYVIQQAILGNPRPDA